MGTLIRYVLITALRDRLFLGMLAATLVATGISAALAATSMIEVREMTLAFSAATSRLILMLGLVVFVAFHIRHAFDAKEIDVMLSRPISRPLLVFSYWMAFCVAALVMTALSAGVVYALGPLSLSGFGTWAFSMLLEAWLVVAFTLFAALVLKSGVITVLTAIGFYTLSRMMGFFLITVGGRSVFESTELNMAFKRAIDWLAIIIPRLDFFAKTRWLSYGVEGMPTELVLFTVQSLIFIPLLLTLAILDFRKRQF